MAEPDAAADLHAPHAAVGTAGEDSKGLGVVSGEAVWGEPAVAGGARERAGSGPAAARGAAPPAAGFGALRAERRTSPSWRGNDSRRATVGGRRGWRQDPVRGRVRTALAPVGLVLDAMTPGQRAVAARAVEVVLRDVAPDDLAAHLGARIGPMSLDGPPADRGVIRSPLGWLLSQLPSITLCGACGTRTTTGAPSVRRAVCDTCARAAAARARGARVCPGCGRLGHGFGEGEQCGRCEHRQAVDGAADLAAKAAQAVRPAVPGASAAARRSVLQAARTAAAEARRRGADPLLQELAARLAARNAAAKWTTGPGAEAGGDPGPARADGPAGWCCADPRCARRSTARPPKSGLCASCERARLHREARTARCARMAAART
jgi:hypothetical protein